MSEVGIAGRACDWLSLAAAPAFAIMALLTAAHGGAAADILCSAAHGSSPLSGMVPMYVLMSVFHSAPWLKLITRQRMHRPTTLEPKRVPADAEPRWNANRGEFKLRHLPVRRNG